MTFKKSNKAIYILAIVALVVVFAATLVACNGKNSVTLSFDSKGGEAVDAIATSGGATVTLPELPAKRENDTVYVFDGWSLNRDLSGDVYRGEISAPAADATFYAIWARGYRLTLNAGSGKLQDDQLYIYLKKGAKIADAVKDIVPSVEGDLTFSAWYFEDERVKDSTVMPDSAVTLVAKYNVGYTISYYLQNYDGEYLEDAQLTKKKSGLVGVQASEDQTDIVIAGYSYNAEMSQNTSRITLTETAAANVLKYYYDIDGYHVTYNANPPEGTVAYGQMDEQIAPYDETLNAADCEFTLAGYRFLGWADWQTGYSPDYDNVNYAPGDRIVFEDDESVITLYAIWQPGFTDAIGGSDFLFLDPEYDLEPGAATRKVYLVREGVEEKVGECDNNAEAADHVFTFKNDGGDVILKGVLNTETNFFYYYNETLYNVDGGAYHSKDDDSVTIALGEDYSATYKDSQREIPGKVTFDTEWGYYVFTSTNFDDADVDASAKLMLRFVFEEDENGNTVLALQNMDEAGYYATAEGYPVIYLDGLGNFRYYFDPEHPTYYDITNEPVLVTNGLYQVNAKGYYECSMYAGDTSNKNNHLEDFIFRLTDTTPKPVGDYTLKAQAIERSSFYGQLANDLYLDGFGGGIYTVFADKNDKIGVKHEGTYEIVHNFWLTENSADANQVWFINFTYDGATADIYYAIQQNRSGTVFAQYFGSVAKGTEGGLLIFDSEITLGGQTYDDAFIMFLLDANNETMVLVKIDEQTLGSGKLASIYAPMFTGTTAKAGDVFNFESVSHDAQMSFKIVETEGKTFAHFVSVTGEGTTGGDRIIDKNLVVHPATSTASWTDEGGVTHDDVKYTYSGSDYIEFYSFRVGDERNLYYYRDVKSNAEKFVKITGDRLVDYAFITEDVMFAYPARLLLAEGGKAYIALPMAIGEPVYVGSGTYTQADGLYSVTFGSWLGDEELIGFFGGEGYEPSLKTFHSYYDEFNFRTEGGDEKGAGEFYVRFDKDFTQDLGNMCFDLSNFKADGYSNEATYTLDSGYELEGTFYRMAIIVVFEVRDSDDKVISSYYLKEDAENNRMKNVSEDAGLYYFYDIDSVNFETFGPDFGGSLTDYIIYDGENSVTVVDIQKEYLENEHPGTMTKTANWTEDFREYEIHETDTGKVYKVLLGSFESVWHETYRVYDLQNNAYSGDYDTSVFGRLHGNGYRLNSSTYDEDGDGVIDYTGLMVRATFDKKDIQTHAYTVDENGDVVVFTYKIDEETSRSIVFDVRTSASGYEYLVERKLIFGSFAAWDVGERTGEYMYLDGQGNAELYNARDVKIGAGTYKLDPEKGETSYLYEDNENKDLRFWFAIYIESEEGGMTYFEYRRYQEDAEGEYDADDWSHLSVNSFGEITYTDRYGVVYQGYYEIDGYDITLYTYDGSGIKFTFRFGGTYFELVSRGVIEVEEPAEPQNPAGEK